MFTVSTKKWVLASTLLLAAGRSVKAAKGRGPFTFSAGGLAEAKMPES